MFFCEKGMGGSYLSYFRRKCSICATTIMHQKKCKKDTFLTTKAIILLHKHVARPSSKRFEVGR